MNFNPKHILEDPSLYIDSDPPAFIGLNNHVGSHLETNPKEMSVKLKRPPGGGSLH